jgi:RNA polymerase sigma factor (sigma-70 family)
MMAIAGCEAQNNFLFLKYSLRKSVYLYVDPSLSTIPSGMSATNRKNIASVVGQFGKRLLSFIRRRVVNEADAEDILQDIWQQLTITVDTEPIEQLSGWLFKVARNKIIDRTRKKKPESLESLLEIFPGAGGDGGNADPDFAGILLDESHHPETAYLRSLFWKALQEALDELPKEQRDVFVWNELDDLSFKEIAARTGEKVNTLISRKRYAVLHLRERLLELYEEIIEH